MRATPPPAREGDLQHTHVLAAAVRRGMRLTDVSETMGCKATLIEAKGRSELLVQGVIASQMNLHMKHLCDHKQLTKAVFHRLEIPTPRSVLIASPTDPAIAGFFEPGRRYVCKPQVAANGIGVEMGLSHPEQLGPYWARCGHLDTRFLLEEQFDGTDLRLQVIGGRVAAACVRVPAHVFGDGEASLRVLIERRRAVIHSQNPANVLEIDHAAQALLDEQQVTLDSVPADGRRIWLKSVSNMGQGGHALDVTGELHPRYHAWVERLVQVCQGGFFALDLMCAGTPADDPVKTAVALELNALAEWIHHTFSERRTHDLGAAVIEAAFGPA